MSSRARVSWLGAAVAAAFATLVLPSVGGCNAILGNELGGLDAGAGATEAGGDDGAVACDVGKKSCGALGCQSVTDPQFGCGGATCDTCVAAHAATTTCFNKNQTSSCASGTCKAGYDDCDSDPTNGCEAQSSDVHTCGGNGACQDCAASGLKFCAPKGGGSFECTNQCSPPNTVCNGGDLCVDLSSDVNHCGTCANDCVATPPPGTPPEAEAQCMKGVCGYACPPGQPQICHGHCVAVDYACPAVCQGAEHRCPNESGCFSPSDVQHCGTALRCVDCTTAAPPNATASGCASDKCVFTCNYPWVDCNGDLNADKSDGCETDASSPKTCGGCSAKDCGTGVCCSGAAAAFLCEPGPKCTVYVSDGDGGISPQTQ